ncbi:Outer membrane porin F [bacterium HR09]|nr:Outer membrane porin F [bacterium HR09]
MKRTWVVLVVVVGVALWGTGCATKEYVQEQVAQAQKVTEAKISEVQKQVEATQMDVANLKKSDAEQNAKIAQLSDTAKEALARAEEAGKLAKGKFLFEVTLSDDAVHFGFNKSDLSAEAKAALDAFAQKVKAENKNVYIEVQGHTDSIGSEKYNLELGQARADAVVRYLNMQHGLPLHSMNAISYGEYKPVADNKTAEGRAKNRRVTLVVLE